MKTDPTKKKRKFGTWGWISRVDSTKKINIETNLLDKFQITITNIKMKKKITISRLQMVTKLKRIGRCFVCRRRWRIIRKKLYKKKPFYNMIYSFKTLVKSKGYHHRGPFWSHLHGPKKTCHQFQEKRIQQKISNDNLESEAKILPHMVT